MWTKVSCILYSSAKWKVVPADLRSELLEGGGKDDGEFWMTYEDMNKYFTDFEICSVSMDELYEDDNGTL